jgi:hypothetical protein
MISGKILQHLKDIKPAVDGRGWFDAEDLYGPLNTYQAIEKAKLQYDCYGTMESWRLGKKWSQSSYWKHKLWRIVFQGSFKKILKQFFAIS